MRVWDAFLFRNDFEVLELRLRELWDVVDVFVLVEADRTFRGGPKALEFTSALEAFGPWSEKIRVVAVEDTPLGGNAWSREVFQRNAIMRGLEGAGSDDVVLISDVDEIPRPEVLGVLDAHLDAQAIIALEQAMYYYSLNWRLEQPWHGTRAVRRSLLDLMTPQGVRQGSTATVSNAGWHFSYLFPQEEVVRRLVEKVRAFSHAEYDTPDYLDEDYIRQCVAGGFRWADSGGFDTVMSYDRVGPLHPRTVQHHLRDFSALLSPEPVGVRTPPRPRTLDEVPSWAVRY